MHKQIKTVQQLGTDPVRRDRELGRPRVVGHVEHHRRDLPRSARPKGRRHRRAASRRTGRTRRSARPARSPRPRCAARARPPGPAAARPSAMSRTTTVTSVTCIPRSAASVDAAVAPPPSTTAVFGGGDAALGEGVHQPGYVGVVRRPRSVRLEQHRVRRTDQLRDRIDGVDQVERHALQRHRQRQPADIVAEGRHEPAKLVLARPRTRRTASPGRARRTRPGASPATASARSANRAQHSAVISSGPCGPSTTPAASSRSPGAPPPYSRTRSHRCRG